ncbi:MAG: HAD-IB family hydrolase [Pseudomonadota bacterium]
MRQLEDHLFSVGQQPNVRPRVAFFDLDRTLIAGYSIIALANETIRHVASKGELGQAAMVLNDVLRLRREQSGSNYHRIVRQLTKALKGVSESTLVDLGQRAYNVSLEKRLYSEAIRLVEAHREAGHELVIVTAASRYQVEPIAKVLGIDEICCTQLEVHNGKFTGKLIAPLCFGEGKTMAARRIAKRYGVSLKDSWFYSDSSDDLPLLKAVGFPCAVNPSDKLREQAENRQWPQLHFSTRGFISVESISRTLLTGQALVATTAVGWLGRKLGVATHDSANMMTQLLGDLGASVAGLNIEVEGRHHLRDHQPSVFVFNHQSLLDTIVLAHLLRRDIVPFCKKEMASNLLIGPLLRQAETVFVDREQSNQVEVLQKSLRILNSGRSLVIAPEGTRSVLGDIQPFKHGAFFLARKARVPIVPIVLHNVKDALPKGALLIRPATVRVTVLPPILPDQIKSVRTACRDTEDQFRNLLGSSRHTALPLRRRFATLRR